MYKLLTATCLALIAPTAHAQVTPQTMTLSGISDCIKDAITSGSVEASGDILMFSCNAARAKALYTFIGRKIRAEVVQDRNGKFENRQFGNGACYHQIEDQSGKAADDFRCDLVMVVGDALGQ